MLDKSLIKTMCDEQGVDVNLVMAMIEVESGGVYGRTRFERHYKYLHMPNVIAHRLGISKETEEIGQMHSYGLLQIMGANMRAYGFSGYWSSVSAEDGLRYGIIHLKKCLDRFEDLQKAIASYNAGSPRYSASGVLENQSYVDKVLNIKARIEGENGK